MNRRIRILLETIADLTGLRNIDGETKRHSRTLDVLKASYRGIGRVASGAYSFVGRELRALRNVTIAGVGATALAVREGSKFNIALAQTVNMFGGNKLALFARFRRELLDLSSASGIATDSLIKGLYQAGSAQFSPDESILALRTAIQGVKADGAELPDVLGGIIAGVKSFGGSVDQTAEQLYRIVQLGQTTFGEVGQYLSQVAPVAQANNVTLGETGAAIAQLTSKTIPLSQSVVQLRNMMSRLNPILGDGWRASMTFQDAMEAVAKSVNYSQTEIGKLFGRESLAGVNAMIGQNFAGAKQQLSEFSGELNGLNQSATFVDQFRGWGRVLQSALNYVREIGSHIEQTWAPRISYIAEKINSIRQGAGFTEIVDRIADKLETTLTNAIAHIQTAHQIIQDITSGGDAAGRLTQMAAAVVTELVTLAVKLLLRQLQALVSVIVGLARIFSTEIKKGILTLDIPLMAGTRRNAALANINKMSPEQMDEAGIPAHLQKQPGENAYMRSARRREAGQWYESLSPDQQASLATFDLEGNSVNNAVEETIDNLGALKDTVAADLRQTAEALKAAAGRATGGARDYNATFAENVANIKSWTAPAASPAPAPATAPAPIPASADATPQPRANIAAFYSSQRQIDREQALIAQLDEKLGHLLQGNSDSLSIILANLKDHDARLKAVKQEIQRLPL